MATLRFINTDILLTTAYISSQCFEELLAASLSNPDLTSKLQSKGTLNACQHHALPLSFHCDCGLDWPL